MTRYKWSCGAKVSYTNAEVIQKVTEKRLLLFYVFRESDVNRNSAANQCCVVTRMPEFVFVSASPISFNLLISVARYVK